MALIEPSLQIAALIDKYLKDEITPSEQAKLNTWLAASEENRELFGKLANEEYVNNGLQFFQQLSTEDARQKVAAQTWEGGKVVSINRDKKRWWYAAAAAVLVAAVFTIYQTSNKKEAGSGMVKNETEKPDINPGGNKAILTLADGSVIVLDSAANGNLTRQGNVTVIKLDGKLSYNSSNANGEVIYNTISTPKGGKYQLVLADGSTVWLNAASSLRFPTSFAGKERKVELSGEGYFDVAKNTTMPFKVNVNGTVEVEVLGTQFNINAYTDEANISTTLVEGKVKVASANNTSQPAINLTPGQQAQTNNNGQIAVNKNANVEEIIAWKNGLFRFNNSDIPSVLRQLSRWYDLEIVYHGQKPEGHISGTVPMNMSLSKVIEVLQLSGVNFRLEGKKMFINP